MIQFLIICALSVMVSTEYAAYTGGIVYQQKDNGGHNTHEYVPVIENGVPVDTPEVQAARAAHLEAVAQAKALNARKSTSGGGGNSYDAGHYTQYANAPAAVQQKTIIYTKAPISYGSSTSNYQNEQSGIGGLDYYQNIDYHHHQQPAQQYTSAILGLQQHGIGQDETKYRTKRSIYNQHVPVIVNGVPLETPEVQSAKALHLLAHAETKALGYSTVGHNSIHNAHSGVIIGKNGVPFDTPEVQIARQQHELAHVQAKFGGGDNYGQQQGPIDTPEVQIAKAEHLAVHAQEAAKHNQWTAAASGYADDVHSNSLYYY